MDSVVQLKGSSAAHSTYVNNSKDLPNEMILAARIKSMKSVI